MTVVIPGGESGDIVAGTNAFADYLDLRTAVLEQLGRTDIADVFPRLVGKAEARFNRELRFREQITDGTVTMAGGRGTLPTNFAEMISVHAANGYEYPAQTMQYASQHGYYYSIQGSDMVSSQISGDVGISYYATIPPLAETVTTTNWLLARYPEVYEYATLFEAAKQVRDGETAAAADTMMRGAIVDARADDNRSRYSRARVRVQGCTP